MYYTSQVVNDIIMIIDGLKLRNFTRKATGSYTYT